jgi:phytoene desaturase
MSDKVLIVGAGPGGLSAAILLAAAGLKVKVIERLPSVGGRTSTIQANGFKFDLGPTFFLYPSALEEIFGAAGADLWEEVELVRLDPQYRILFGQGGQLDCTSDVGRMEEAIAKIAPGDASAFRRFLAENRLKFERMKPFLASPFQSWQDMASIQLLRMLPLLRPHQSLDTYLKRFFADERVRLAFSFQSKYLGMSPFTCPSLFSILSFLEYEEGVWHPVGGCGALTAAMARLAKRLGVEILTEEPVEKMIFEKSRAIGLQTRSSSYFADAIVINGDFARSMERLVPNRLRRRWTDQKIRKKKFSCSTFMIYLGIEGSFKLPHHTIYISADYAKNIEEVEKRHVLSEDPSFYVQNAGVTDSTLAPAGCSTLYILVPVPHQNSNVDWNKERDGFRNQILRQIAKAGFVDLERRIRYERVITPDDWDRRYEIHKGATFNLAHSLDQMLYLRPHNRFEDLDRVYLVGGGTHPGSGLPVIFESARSAPGIGEEGISVLIPARNEERNIGAAALGVLANRDVRIELIVLDDHSTDRTAEIVSALSRRDSRLRLEESPILPEGWCGKQHACDVLAKCSRHSFLVFLDADVRLSPDALRRMLAFIKERNVALASGIPDQELGTFSEWLLLPLIHFILLSFLPLRRMRGTTSPACSAGCGQLFIARREPYQACGGHASIRNSLHDGLQLPRAFRRAGFRTDLFDATDLASCRMFRSNLDVWRGLARNATEALASPGTIVPMTVLLVGGQVLPLLLLLCGFALTEKGLLSAALALLFALLPRMIASWRFRQPILSALLHPLAVIGLVGIQWFALVTSFAGRPLQWKGRAYRSRLSLRTKIGRLN